MERIKEYLEVTQEAPARVTNPPPAKWPSSEGGIVVENLVIRYASDLPAVLKGITFTINPREKIGVVSAPAHKNIACSTHVSFQVGRTGSGKVTSNSARGIALLTSRLTEHTCSCAFENH